jgi:hypothetical protein
MRRTLTVRRLSRRLRLVERHIGDWLDERKLAAFLPADEAPPRS